jgi:hypothetical protein
MFYILQILQEKWKYNERVHQLFIDFKKAYDSVRREVLYVQYSRRVWGAHVTCLIRICLNETYSNR